MGKYTVQFACHHTGHCCTDVVCLPTPWDVIRIVREEGTNPYDFLEFLSPDEIEGVTKGDPTWLNVDGERYIMALRRGKKGCHFLDKKTRYCSIYEARPILCRLYPFKLDEFRDGTFKGFSLHGNVGCPKHKDGTVDAVPLYELYLEDSTHQQDYNDLVAVFNGRQYPGKAPEDFIAMFVQCPRTVPSA